MSDVSGLYPTFLMSPPLFVETDTPNNALMRQQSEAERKIDHGRAMRQFLDLYNFIAASSLVWLLPAVSGLQDQTFTSNLGVAVGGKIVVSNFRSAPRVGEAPIGEAFFKSLGMGVEQCPFYFEGEADLKPLSAKTWFGGFGQRTSFDALRWFSETFGIDVVPLRLKDERNFHMDCVIGVLTGGNVMLATGLCDKEAVKDVELVANVIPVGDAEAHAGITNCLRLGRLLLCDSSAPSLPADSDEYAAERSKEIELERICARLGLELVLFNMSEFDKSGAALSCHMMRLNDPQDRPEESW